MSTAVIIAVVTQLGHPSIDLFEAVRKCPEGTCELFESIPLVARRFDDGLAAFGDEFNLITGG